MKIQQYIPIVSCIIVGFWLTIHIICFLSAWWFYKYKKKQRKNGPPQAIVRNISKPNFFKLKY